MLRNGNNTSEKSNIMTVNLSKRRKLKILHGAIILKAWMRDNYNTLHCLQQRQGDLHVTVKPFNLKTQIFSNVMPCH